MAVSTLIPWLLAIPLSGAVVCLLVPQRWGGRLTLLAAACQCGVALAFWRAVRVEGAQTHALGNWGAPLGIELYADSVTALMALTSALVVLAVGFYAYFYLRQTAYGLYFWSLFWFVVAALNGIWLAADIFNLYVGLELLSLAAVGLVAITGGGAALAAALRYLLMALLGSLLYLLGVALIYAATGTLSLQELSPQAQPGTTLRVAFVLMTMGLAFKTALWPLHAWLPPAHGGALTPVSALLSALVVKASFYILVRLWLNLGPDMMTPLAAQLLGLLGAGAILWGGLLALRQVKLKMVAAYSTVAQIGYLFLLFPLALGTPSLAASSEAATMAWNGTLLQIVSHALAKAALFMALGNLILASGREGVKDLIGVSRHHPTALASIGLAGMSLMGLPPSGGFLAKWLMLQSALMTGQWWWVLVLIVGSLLTAAYLFRVLRQPFLLSSARPAFVPISPALEIAPLVLALAAVVLGLTAAGPLALLQPELPLKVPAS